MSKDTVRIDDLATFLIDLSKIQEGGLRAVAAAEVGKCVYEICSKHLGREAVTAEVEKMLIEITQYPCYGAEDDVRRIQLVASFIRRNFS